MAARRFAPLAERLLAKVEIDEDGCWLWTGALWAAEGYGKIYAGRRLAVHRVAYELMVGPIPDGLYIDHRCHLPDECHGGACKHRRCVNPDHMALCTHAENCASTRSRAGRAARERLKRVI